MTYQEGVKRLHPDSTIIILAKHSLTRFQNTPAMPNEPDKFTL